MAAILSRIFKKTCKLLLLFYFYFFFLFTDLQTEFRTVPQPVQGIAGDSVVLECEAPRGHPEPQIRWKKNGQSLELDLDLGVDSDR